MEIFLKTKARKPKWWVDDSIISSIWNLQRSRAIILTTLQAINSECIFLHKKNCLHKDAIMNVREQSFSIMLMTWYRDIWKFPTNFCNPENVYRFSFVRNFELEVSLKHFACFYWGSHLLVLPHAHTLWCKRHLGMS